MPRKLKVYQTSIGFFDLAIAAPSMKAALEIWGADSNLFHQGFARETTDPKTVEAAIDNPGIVLKGRVGTDQSFALEAKLPKNALAHGYPKSRAETPKSKPPSFGKQDAKARKASVAYERESGKRQKIERREEARRAKERARRDMAVQKATQALDAAKAEHDDRMREIQKERAELDDRADAETAKWEKTRIRLEAALQKART